ncbi:hybrid sensor histidine kinase/response regulator [Sphingomonas bacterium]|uniref:hybrid sensor histidine kinase/response regulator n=1 Tax=Sphingomonas bacterium TaxID=1895847 RepID=UPI00157728D3|nr:PAS domain-containing protein [Sphingomonas bacterium]
MTNSADRDPAPLPEHLGFLAGGGLATRLILDRDWTVHPLGEPATWPDGLKVTLSTILNSPESMILAWGRDELTFFFNETYFPLLGPRLAWAMGAPFREVWADAWEQAKPIVDDAFAGRSQRFNDLPWKLDTDRGVEDTWFTFSYSRILDPRGEVAGLFIFTNETTARVLADRALAQSQEELHALNRTLEQRVRYATADRDRTWNNARDLLLVIDLDGVIRAVNPAWTVTVGWLEADLVGRSYLDFIHPDDGAPSNQALESASSAVLPAFENRYRHKSGGYRTISWNAAPEEDLVYASGRDVTEERELAAQLLLHRNIVMSNPNPILAFDRQLRVMAFNQAHQEKLRETQGVGSEVGDYFPAQFIPEERTAITALMERALTGELFTSRAEFGDPAHARLHWDIHYSPLRDGNGDIIGASHHAIEVTAQIDAERALAASQEALRQAQKMEAVGQLTGGLAHDFNNLLTGMMGNLELLQMRIARGRLDDVDRFISAAQGAGRRAASLTQRLLAFSRRQTLDPKPTDVNRLIMGLEELLRRTVGAGFNIEIAPATGLWIAEIDAAQLENAILNLCINGRDAMPDGGCLTVETANEWIDDRTASERDLSPGQYVSICVTDTGTGMSAETIQRAFEPFYTTKPIGQGTGLGLSMIYGFAKQSGGQVLIRSQIGQGSTVCIYLPRHHGEVVAPEEVDAGALTGTVGAQTVLVVDDEATIRHLIDEVLDELGYTVIGAADGAAGVKVLQSSARIELLITDVGLPNGMNGRQVADEARRLRPGLKVLFITGFAENAAVGNGHLEPGMELLTKPFTLEALSTKVADMLRTTTHV